VPISIIDRRAEVLSGPDDLRGTTLRVSDLRSRPFLVLLGEPGIGKSTVLQQEANAEGSAVVRVRALLNGLAPPPGTPLFLDALDEYRSDGAAADKAYALARAIRDARCPRWRLTCRSEDWRKEADVGPIEATVNGASIVVAQILPLNHNEALAVLAAIGETDPEAFLEQARDLGAACFLENPLSLLLLQRAVAQGGAWPRTRFDLFEAAIRDLSFERDRSRLGSDRRAPAVIVKTAAEACLLLLVTGAKALWRSNDEPPGDEGTRAYLTAHDLGQAPALLRGMLDTALFRGEGEAFEPMHRTLAEFLAGCALAGAVRGGGGRAALPLSRALALVTAGDSAPPTELRGVFGWFAAHLARVGDATGALRLIEADAPTVLAYGDAAAFDTAARRAILANLARRDPYFRMSEVGVTAVGGLSGEDLAEEFAAVLRDPGERTHRTITVFDAIASGQPMTSLGLLLRDIAVDPTRAEWMRWRAARAWLQLVPDAAAARREILDVVASEPVSIARENVRVHLAASMPAAELPLGELKGIIADYERCGDDNMIGRLVLLYERLSAEPRPELFEEPVTNWRPGKEYRHRATEVEGLLHHGFKAALRTTPGLDGGRLWHWIVNLWNETWDRADSETAKVIRAWIDEDVDREIALSRAILADTDSTNGPREPGHRFVKILGRFPGPAVVLDFLAQAGDEADPTAQQRLFAVTAELALTLDAGDAAFWAVHERLASNPVHSSLAAAMLQTEIVDWRLRERERALGRQRSEAATRARSLAQLEPLIEAMRAGHHLQALNWAAERYWHKDGSRTGLSQVEHFSNPMIVEAAVEGWRRLATTDAGGLTAERLGVLQATNMRNYAELAALVGLARLLFESSKRAKESSPIVLALIALRNLWWVHDDEQRTALRLWAIERLNLDPRAGRACLLAYWETALEAGATELHAIEYLADHAGPNEALHGALADLLVRRPALLPRTLSSALSAAAHQMSADRLLGLADAAIVAPATHEEQRALWRFVRFVLDPASDEAVLLAELGEPRVIHLIEHDVNEPLLEALASKGDRARMRYDALTIRLFGPTTAPFDEDVDDPASRFEGRLGRIRGAIAALSKDQRAEAGSLLAAFMQDPSLARWQDELRHARAQHLRGRRDREFQHPLPAVVLAAISGGPPVSAADLLAVVTEELYKLRSELRTGENSPWKRYWNVSSTGAPVTPRIENECRDHLLDRLRDRLGRYGVVASLPEARQGDDTRADALILSHSRGRLPIEAKRHYHPAIWTAASTQLQGYAASQGADGYGIYLVFWFGARLHPTPPRPDGAERPVSAETLEAMLRTDLSEELRTRTTVVVFDVSNAASSHAAKPARTRKARRSKSPSGKG
jgi:hypothetical protein